LIPKTLHCILSHFYIAVGVYHLFSPLLKLAILEALDVVTTTPIPEGERAEDTTPDDEEDEEDEDADLGEKIRNLKVLFPSHISN
jgi:hypothetical protein